MLRPKIKNNGKDHIRLVHAIRKPNKGGLMVSTKKVLLHVLDAGNGYIASKLPLTSVGKVKRFLLKEMAVLKELGLSTYEKMEPVFHDLA